MLKLEGPKCNFFKLSFQGPFMTTCDLLKSNDDFSSKYFPPGTKFAKSETPGTKFVISQNF